MEIKLWRTQGAEVIPATEVAAARVMGWTLAGLTIVVALLTGATIIMTNPLELEPSVIPTILVSVAVNGASAAAVFLYRSVKRSYPFETTPRWLRKNLGPIVGSLIFNVLQLMGLTTVLVLWLTGLVPGWEATAEAVKVYFAVAGLAFSVLAGFLSGGWSIWRWTTIEELQRKIPETRPIVDTFERRDAV